MPIGFIFEVQRLTWVVRGHITLFRTVTMLCGTDNILQNILHILTECGEYFA